MDMGKWELGFLFLAIKFQQQVSGYWGHHFWISIFTNQTKSFYFVIFISAFIYHSRLLINEYWYLLESEWSDFQIPIIWFAYRDRDVFIFMTNISTPSNIGENWWCLLIFLLKYIVYFEFLIFLPLVFTKRFLRLWGFEKCQILPKTDQ